MCVWPGQSCWASSDFLLSSWWRRKGSKAQAQAISAFRALYLAYPVWVCIITGLTLSLVVLCYPKVSSSSKPRHPSCSWDRSYVWPLSWDQQTCTLAWLCKALHPAEHACVSRIVLMCPQTPSGTKHWSSQVLGGPTGRKPSAVCPMEDPPQLAGPHDST